MNVKQKWLAERLIIPAGILPPVVSYADLTANKTSLDRTGVTGIEYVLLMAQDTNKINHSAIGGRIPAVHAPFPFFGHSSLKNNMALIELVTNIVYGKNRISNNDAKIIADESFDFAKKVGAKLIVFHLYHLDHNDLSGSLAYLDKLEKEFKIMPVIEHEAAYLYDLKKNPWKYFKKFNNSYDWALNPEIMIKTLDKIYPKKKFGICLDTCSLMSVKLPLLETVKKVYPRIAHVHLADSLPGLDLAMEVQSQEDVEIVRFLYQNKFAGLINTEVNMTMGAKEELLGQIYGATALLRLPIFKKESVQNAQRHIENSCNFLLENI